MSVLKPTQDPLGVALLQYFKTNVEQIIKVSSIEAGNDKYQASYFFRKHNQMPKIEQEALKLAKGKVLDVGAAAGCHSIILNENKDIEVKAIDVSPACVEVMKARGLNAELIDVWDMNEKFDTVYLLMNGIGLAGTISKLKDFLVHLKSLLNSGGKLIFDSSDIIHLFIDSDEDFTPDLSSDYYGEISFSFKYQKTVSPVFKWLYLDEQTAKAYIEDVGFRFKVISRGKQGHYLAECTKI